MISRRRFLEIAHAVGLSAILPPIQSSCSGDREIPGKIIGANASLGHRLRSMEFGAVTGSVKTDILIVGGGVSGLSAARYLKKFTSNFMLCELEQEVGGNSVGGSNNVSKYPWGAHYLPLPENTDPELIGFLRDANVITGVKNGLPVYNEYYLCHDPKERLFIHNYWQEGLIPHEGVPKNERDEIQRFLELMNNFKTQIGRDNRPAFAIPLSECSQDPQLVALSGITAEDFLVNNDFSSPYLKWYVNYCCADDFGSSLTQTSAWAMIHYFASRRGKAANATSDSVLTWPEGNHWLVSQLRKGLDDNISPNQLVYDVRPKDGHIECLSFDAVLNRSIKIVCDRVIMATPQYINQRILNNVERNVDYTIFRYAPWMVANITTSHLLTDKRGEGLCWDNVIYGSNALGYVNSAHQQLGFHGSRRVITYYKPLLGDDVTSQRKAAQQKTFESWREEIIADLKKPHPQIARHVDEMNVWIWGHGMMLPGKKVLWGDSLRRAKEPVFERIFFAHSDISGISIFEEAFYQGHTAAKAAINT